MNNINYEIELEKILNDINQPLRSLFPLVLSTKPSLKSLKDNANNLLKSIEINDQINPLALLYLNEAIHINEQFCFEGKVEAYDINDMDFYDEDGEDIVEKHNKKIDWDKVIEEQRKKKKEEEEIRVIEKKKEEERLSKMTEEERLYEELDTLNKQLDNRKTSMVNKLLSQDRIEHIKHKLSDLKNK